MGWSLFEERPKSRLTRSFLSKYTMTIDTEVMVGSIFIKSKAEVRWQLEVLKVTENFAQINIIMLHHRILESNSPMISDIAGLSMAFGNMYSELELVINDRGKVEKIINLEDIRKKWQWVKQDMEKLIDEDPSLKDVILLNDELFSSDKKIIQAVEANDFFSIYFHQFWGIGIPSSRNGVIKYNLLNTAEIKYFYTLNMRVAYDKEGDRPMEFTITAYPETTINKSWIKETYKGFAHLPLEGMKPEFNDESIYLLASYGKIYHAVVKKSEVMHPTLLYVKYRYDLKADDEINELEEYVEHVKQYPLRDNTMRASFLEE